MEVQKEDIFTKFLSLRFSVVWLGIAFGIAIAGGIDAFKDLVGLRTIIVESLVVVFFCFCFFMNWRTESLLAGMVFMLFITFGFPV